MHGPHHTDHHPPHRHRARHGEDRRPAATDGSSRSGSGRELVANGGAYAGFTDPANICTKPLMSNVTADRRVENDWWDKPIPPNVTWGRVSIAKRPRSSAFHAQRGAAGGGARQACLLLRRLLVFAREGRHCTVGDFTLLNGALIMAEERIEIGSYCLISWNVGIADSDFHPLAPAQRRVDALALAPLL